MRMLQSARHLVVFSVISNVLLLVAPIHMMQVYDRVLVSSSGETLFYISLIAVVMLSVDGVSELLRSRMATKLSAKYVLAHVDSIFGAISNGNVGLEGSQKVMREFDNVRQFIASRSMVSLFDLPFAPVFLLLLFLLHIQIGLLTLLGALALPRFVIWTEFVIAALVISTATRRARLRLLHHGSPPAKLLQACILGCVLGRMTAILG